MRVLFDTTLPFAFAHGGVQVAYEQTARALEELGIETGKIEWWSKTADGDVVHFFGRPAPNYIDYAHMIGLRVVFTDLLGAIVARPPLLQSVQRIAMLAARRYVPHRMLDRLAWASYEKADACLALTQCEAEVMVKFLKAPAERVHTIQNGVDNLFKSDTAVDRDGPLVCVATIRPLKRVLELARAAGLANVPVRFVGKPYASEDPYYREFLAVVESHECLVYEGSVESRDRLADIYRRARGFVLVSTMESHSLAAAEAAACGCPLLLSDLPWARSVYGERAAYSNARAGMSALVNDLQCFHEDAPNMPPPPCPLYWRDVARELIDVYEAVLSVEIPEPERT